MRDFDNRYDQRFKGMNTHPLKSVTLDTNKDLVTFSFEGAPDVKFSTDADCCSSSWIEHIDVPPYVLGEYIIDVIESSEGDAWDNHECGSGCGHDVLAVYNTRFRTPKGDIVLEYRNDSNGYYGGSLERAS